MRRVPFSLSLALTVIACCLPLRSVHAQDPTVCEAYGFPYFCNLTITPAAFQSGSITWADLDGDGLQDIVLSGAFQFEPDLQFWRNVGEFVVITPPPDETKPPGVGYETRYRETATSAGFGVQNEIYKGATLATDLTGDGMLDIVATGIDRVDSIKTLVFENAYPSFPEFVRIHVGAGIIVGAMISADFDNDGDTDVVMTGETMGNTVEVVYLRNDIASTGAMTEEILPLTGLSIGSLDVGDFDGDLDMDLLLTGKTPSNDSVTRIYRNDNGTLVESGIQLPGLLFSRARFVDVDQDGDLDIALTGARLTPFVVNGAGIILENSGGAFSSAASFPGRYFGGLTTGDVDGDGQVDLLVSGGLRLGQQNKLSFLSNVNNGSAFVEHTSFGGGLFGQVVVGDYDGDLDLDILMFGKLDSGGNRFRPYRNEGSPPNTAPVAPVNLASSVSGPSVQFSWDPGSDAETVTTVTLSYNLRVGTESGLNDVMPSNASAAGRRLLSARGNTDHNTAWRLGGLPSGTYYWSVQTIDSALAGSPFSVEQTFVIP